MSKTPGTRAPDCVPGFGISGDTPVARTLWTWVNAAKLQAIDPAGELTAETRKRIRDLEKENVRLQRDLEFEKKAGAFFRELDQNENDSL